MFFLKCIVIGIAWTVCDWLFDLCERKLPAVAWEIIRWMLVPFASVVCMLGATWLFEGGVLWPLFAWPVRSWGRIHGAAEAAHCWNALFRTRRVHGVAAWFGGLGAFSDTQVAC